MAVTVHDVQKGATDLTDAGIDIAVQVTTSPAGAVPFTRLDVGSGETVVPMDASNPGYMQLTASTAEIGNVTNSGTFAVQAAQSGAWNITNVSGTVSLPTGAATAAKQPALGTAGVASADVITIQGVASMTAVVVDGSGVTQPISAASLPLPSGASTAAKQPALGTAGTASSDVISVQGIASMTAIVVDGSGVTQPVSAASLPLPSGASTAANQSTANTALAAIQTAVEILDNIVSGSEAQVDIVAALPAGSNAIGTVGVTSTTAATSGGATPGKLVSAASTNATNVKASAGQLFSLSAMNTNAAVRYLKFYNKASTPTVGTDVPVQVYAIPGNTAGAGFVIPIPVCGIAFGTGISFATTTGAADSDTGAVAANEIVISYSYK